MLCMTACLGLLYPFPPESDRCLPSEQGLSVLKLNCLGLREFELFDDVDPGPPNVGFPVVQEVFVASLSIDFS